MPIFQKDLLNIAYLVKQDKQLSHLPDAIINQVKQVSLKGQQNLFTKGAPPEFLFYLISGCINLTRCSESGISCTLQHVQRGFISEASLFASVYHCNATAQIDSLLLAFPINSMLTAFDDAVFRNFWIQSLSHEVRRLRTQVERLSLKTATERILHYLESEGEYNRAVSHKSKKDWASELGITHEALYRSLSELAQSGSIVCMRDLVRLSES